MVLSAQSSARTFHNSGDSALSGRWDEPLKEDG
jgi:hypothetical protein